MRVMHLLHNFLLYLEKLSRITAWIILYNYLLCSNTILHKIPRHYKIMILKTSCTAKTKLNRNYF